MRRYRAASNIKKDLGVMAFLRIVVAVWAAIAPVAFLIQSRDARAKTELREMVRSEITGLKLELSQQYAVAATAVTRSELTAEVRLLQQQIEAAKAEADRARERH